jgi:peptidylglycine monooxygenase
LITDQIPRLSLVSPEGRLLGRCRPVLNGAHGIACAADGVIYLAEINPSRISRLVPVS